MPNESPSGFGLLGMRERVELADGAFQLDSERGEGTTLHGSLPMRDS